MPLVSYQGRLTIYSREMVNIPQDKLGGIKRLLRPLKVYNPYADRLSFASDRTRLRRDHSKYLTLIQAIARLHHYRFSRCAFREWIGWSDYQVRMHLDKLVSMASRSHMILFRQRTSLLHQNNQCVRIDFIGINCFCLDFWWSRAKQ